MKIYLSDLFIYIDNINQNQYEITNPERPYTNVVHIASIVFRVNSIILHHPPNKTIIVVIKKPFLLVHTYQYKQ